MGWRGGRRLCGRGEGGGAGGSGGVASRLNQRGGRPRLPGQRHPHAGREAQGGPQLIAVGEGGSEDAEVDWQSSQLLQHARVGRGPVGPKGEARGVP